MGAVQERFEKDKRKVFRIYRKIKRESKWTDVYFTRLFRHLNHSNVYLTKIVKSLIQDGKIVRCRCGRLILLREPHEIDSYDKRNLIDDGVENARK